MEWLPFWQLWGNPWYMYVEVVHNACMHIYTQEASVNKRVVYQDSPQNAKKANDIKKKRVWRLKLHNGISHYPFYSPAPFTLWESLEDRLDSVYTVCILLCLLSTQVVPMKASLGCFIDTRTGSEGQAPKRNGHVTSQGDYFEVQHDSDLRI